LSRVFSRTFGVICAAIDRMVVSVSVALLLLLIAVMQMRNGSLKLGNALTCVLLGFCLASTSLAPTIESTLTSTASLVGTIHP
jgi:hypothetical protein